MKKGDLSKFVEDAVRWRMLDRTIQAWKERNPGVTDEQLMAAFERAVRDAQGISVGHEA